jgi:PAS domain-containing protein
MSLTLEMAESLAQKAAEAIRAGASLSNLEQIPAAAYATDKNGFITYFNSSCPEFTGRAPQVGEDRWCVTWKLYTNDGIFLPHASCPMADAIHSKQPVRGVTAVAERPDGTRVAFAPLPFPIVGEDGELTGAINVLVDVTKERIAELSKKAKQARRLAFTASHPIATPALLALADECEAKVAVLRA